MEMQAKHYTPAKALWPDYYCKVLRGYYLSAY